MDRKVGADRAPTSTIAILAPPSPLHTAFAFAIGVGPPLELGSRIAIQWERSKLVIGADEGEREE